MCRAVCGIAVCCFQGMCCFDVYVSICLCVVVAADVHPAPRRASAVAGSVADLGRVEAKLCVLVSLHHIAVLSHHLQASLHHTVLLHHTGALSHHGGALLVCPQQQGPSLLQQRRQGMPLDTGETVRGTITAQGVPSPTLNGTE